MPPRASTSAAQGPPREGKKLSPLELKLLTAGLAAPKGQISQHDLLAACGLSISSAMEGINALLRKNLAQMLRAESGDIFFRFVKRDEAKQAASMDADEKLVLDQIKDAGNLGIWTRTLNVKTGLPSGTVLKALKALESRKQVKTVKSVKNPTRKIYMLVGVQPSVELTGGPWFTDNELDTELVDTLKKVVHRYLQDHSIPRSITISDPSTSNPVKLRPIYPVSATPHLPTAQSVLQYISRIEAITVELLPEHIEALLDLMIYDGSVEKVLVNRDGTAAAAAAANNGKSAKRGDDSDDDEDDDAAVSSSKKNGKSKGKGKATTKSSSSKSKRKKSAAASSDSSDSDEDARSSSRRKKGKRAANGKAPRKRAKREDDDDEDESSESSDDFDSDEEAPNRRRKKGSDGEDGQEDEDDDGRKKSSRKRRKDRRKKRVKRSSSDSDDGGSGDDDEGAQSSESEDEAARARRRNGVGAGDEANGAAAGGSQYVYRLVRQYAPTIGWTDMPCGKCPVEEFCSEPPRMRAQSYRRPPAVAANPTNPNAVLASAATSVGAPKLRVELEGGIQGVGMLGGAGAAIGVSEAKWGEMKGAVGAGVAPINPVSCPYFDAWLTF
ncbi:hypothetical protein Rhopal_003983-T1 [Rhodotorula paludigena]|uniref:DNA-directed RNA polymerase III subunit RPC6 n=1 Tax=Rhodotorula paludigena TaxID=86838 RepID=A0AAV5GKG4_9BASI|nr:hypothetical protein Rhopal_003983-T1 [Rhodotorula paludigena]